MDKECLMNGERMEIKWRRKIKKLKETVKLCPDMGFCIKNGEEKGLVSPKCCHYLDFLSNKAFALV